MHQKELVLRWKKNSNLLQRWTKEKKTLNPVKVPSPQAFFGSHSWTQLISPPHFHLLIKSKHKMLNFFFFEEWKKLRHLKVLRQKYSLKTHHKYLTYWKQFKCSSSMYLQNPFNNKNECYNLTDHFLCSYTIPILPAWKKWQLGRGNFLSTQPVILLY